MKIGTAKLENGKTVKVGDTYPGEADCGFLAPAGELVVVRGGIVVCIFGSEGIMAMSDYLES